MNRRALLLSSLAAAGGAGVLGKTLSAGAQAQTAAAPALALSASDRALLLSLPDRPARDAAEQIGARFNRAWWAPTLEVYNFVGNPSARRALLDNLRRDTGADWGRDTNRWWRWLWNQPAVRVAGYDQFKADFYRQIDARFRRYFEGRGDSALIRLDEIRWGGVLQDGIPPLRRPKMLSVAEADYLDDDNVVFGIEVNGDVRAYPKRILAWHEMFTDRVGGVEVAGVYCTLCGTVVLYDTVHRGETHRLGTSGFLYRSNKLMYDQATQSLWNTLRGSPVVGPLVGRGIELPHRSVVTTTWGKWRSLHPDTQVLSLDTGHRRDYAEGVAYHDYFADDELMFNTPFQDQRLLNKREVLALRFPGQAQTVAIDTEFLRANPVYQSALGRQPYVVLTDETGANRVYDPKGQTLVGLRGQTATDQAGRTYQVREAELVASDGTRLPRLPYHRAFWFGWQAAFPDTELVK